MLSPGDLLHWAKVVDGIDTSHVPIQYIKKLVVKKVDGGQKTINVERLLNRGLDADELQEVIADLIVSLGELKSIQPHFNLEYIASVAGPATDKLLGKR